MKTDKQQQQIYNSAQTGVLFSASELIRMLGSSLLFDVYVILAMTVFRFLIFGPNFSANDSLCDDVWLDSGDKNEVEEKITVEEEGLGSGRRASASGAKPFDSLRRNSPRLPLNSLSSEAVVENRKPGFSLGLETAKNDQESQQVSEEENSPPSESLTNSTSNLLLG